MMVTYSVIKKLDDPYRII